MKAIRSGLVTIDMDWCPYKAVAARMGRDDDGDD